ncbi:hypothetical protein COJ96_05670 [Bacillus sp. AFS073361]|uniref:hypothetical protein n=1 Tax=Bacillus sp. AFS073361 TaxID=2033511 RepID=UPI000BF7A6D7|nr:hypothetical protein [Bacillus sp. AFS073361]PFP30202.1 hypothetical protein COJ96_05670 [Bacillus sp. AFS073361]
MSDEQNENEIYFNFFDLVRVDGYWPRVFRVDGYHTDTWRYPNETWTETVYELVDAHSGEFLEADVEDLTLVETADKADAWLAANPAPTGASKPLDTSEWAIDISKYFGGVMNMAKKEPRKPTARELSAQLAKEAKAARKKRGEQIDNLLDLRNWAADMLAKTNDEAYGDRVMAIDAKLKEIVETE